MKKRLKTYAAIDDEEPALNLTPLIDVVFVVLILFILVAPMLEVDKVELASGGEKGHLNSVSHASPLSIHVESDDSIWIRAKKVAVDELIATLREEKVKNPGQTPQLFQDKKARFGTYQTVKNAMEAAGFEELDVILQPGGL